VGRNTQVYDRQQHHRRRRNNGSPLEAAADGTNEKPRKIRSKAGAVASVTKGDQAHQRMGRNGRRCATEAERLCNR